MAVHNAPLVQEVSTQNLTSITYHGGRRVADRSRNPTQTVMAAAPSSVENQNMVQSSVEEYGIVNYSIV